MNDHASFSVLRLYKNANSETIRIDEVIMSGTFIRKGTFSGLGGYQENPNMLSAGEPRWNFGDWIFHCSGRGRVVKTEVLVTAGVGTVARTVTEVEMVGSWLAIDTATSPGATTAGPYNNYLNVTWRGGVIDMSDLPRVESVV